MEIIYTILFVNSFMATGETFRPLSFQYRISHCYIGQNTLNAIIESLMTKAIPFPSEEIFATIADKYFKKWNYPNCIGGIDGKHVRIVCPAKTSSLHYNYKEFFSIVLMAIVDPEYKFIAIDVGAYGREGDSGVYSRSTFGKKNRYEKFQHTSK